MIVLYYILILLTRKKIVSETLEMQMKKSILIYSTNDYVRRNCMCNEFINDLMEIRNKLLETSVIKYIMTLI